jgi:polygalacturonase
MGAAALLVGSMLLMHPAVATPPDSLRPVGHEGRVGPLPSPAGRDPARVCDVTKFGAVGDNVTEDTAAITAAIAHCAGQGGGMVLLPAPGRYLSRPLTIGDGAHFRIESGATLMAWGDLKTWPSRVLSPPYRGQLAEGLSFLVAASPGKHCNASNAISFMHNVTLDGGGTIDAQGWRWWACVNLPGAESCYLRPRTLILYCINNLVVRNITVKDSPMFHIAAYGDNLLFEDVKLRSPSDPRMGCGYGVAPNTDGFNVGGSNIRILNSYACVRIPAIACQEAA